MINLGFLVGGPSIEHDFTFTTLNYIVSSIYQQNNHNLSPKVIYYISQQNDLYVYKFEKQKENFAPKILKEIGEKIDYTRLVQCIKEDKVFLYSLLQGKHGEDGHFQALGELYKIPSNFDNILAASICANKWCQSILAQSICNKELSQIQTQFVDCNLSGNNFITISNKWQDYECILKPNSLGGSYFVELHSHLNLSILELYRKKISMHDSAFLIQHRVIGDEIACCCIVKNKNLYVLPLLKVNQRGVVMDYEEKYKYRRYEWIFTNLDMKIKKNIYSICNKLHSFYQFNSCVRFDFIINNKKIYLLEINNVPGIYEDSLFNRALNAAGLNIIDLINLNIKDCQLYM